MNRLLLAITILTLSTPGIYAQNYNPKFDEGPNLAEFIKVATEDPALQTNMPYPPVVVEAAKTISLKEEFSPSLSKEFIRPGAGYFYGPYPPRIYNSGPYQNGQSYIPLLQAHESPTAYKLIAQWDNDINTTRSGLLDEANTLDPKDRSLYAEAAQLDQNAAALNQEREKINAEVAQWNQQCAGQKPTPYCTNWGNELNKKLASIKQRIAAHNAKVDNWRTRKKDFDGAVGAFVNRVTTWEKNISNFIDAAKAFLNGQTVCFFEHSERETQMVGNPPHPLYLTACFYICGDHTWSFAWASENGFRTCPANVVEGQVPLKPFQRQSPDFSQPDPTFKK